MALALEQFVNEALANQEFYWGLQHDGEDSTFYAALTDTDPVRITLVGDHLEEVDLHYFDDKADVDHDLGFIESSLAPGVNLFLGAQHPDGQ